MLEALEEHFAGKASWTRPQGGLFIWATLNGEVDTTDLLANSQGVAFVPGRAAYMDERSGASSMRLNFAGVPDEDIREGVRRIGQIMSGRAGLFGILTGSSPGRQAGSQRSAAATADTPERGTDGEAGPGSGLADVVEFPRRGEPGRTGEQSDR
jgi:2-aminoadipate transaminase